MPLLITEVHRLAAMVVTPPMFVSHVSYLYHPQWRDLQENNKPGPPFFLSSLVFPLWGASEHRLSVLWKTIKQASRRTESQERKKENNWCNSWKQIWWKVMNMKWKLYISKKFNEFQVKLTQKSISRHNKIA